jgi:Tol biopolymer transport system component
VKSGEIKLVKDHSLSPAISEDGRYISYEYSPSPDGGTLPMLMLYDTTTGKEIEICKTSGGNKAGWYMPDIRIEKNIIYFHSTYWGELREYQYNIEKGDLT